MADDRILAMSAYIEGKMKRYNLLFAVNGGAFAIARLMLPTGSIAQSGQPELGLGGLNLKTLAIGAVFFTIVMCVDIWRFGQMMRGDFFSGKTVFSVLGRIILGSIGVLLIGGWVLVAFGKS
jgi:hypothetical protein